MAGWGDEEIRQLAKAYFHVLREESAGRSVNKTSILTSLDAGGFTRGIQNRKDRCARISEQLQLRGLPIVAGWRPPGAVGRTPTSLANQEQIWRVIEPMLAAELGIAEATDDPTELEIRAASLTMITATSTAPPGSLHPTVSTSVASTFFRDPGVVRYVREVAADKCELCGSVAPFVTDTLRPYLEIHHVKRLADGGSDRVTNAVALCPNCHRRCHHASDRISAVQTLYRTVSRLVME